MFERFTETARRAVFFARYEASETRNLTIENWHLLLGIVREDPRLATRILGGATLAEFRQSFAAHFGNTPSATSGDMPLSAESREALNGALDEAELARSAAIGPEHMLAGILHTKGPAVEALTARGITLEFCRAEWIGESGAPRRSDIELQAGMLPEERLFAAAKILASLSAPVVTVEVTTTGDHYVIRFPEEPAS